MPLLSIVIPTLNEAEYLPGLLDALFAQKHAADEVIVADAGSADDTVALARQRGARVVAGGTPPVGRNRGAAVASGEVLLFLDADVCPDDHFVRDLLDAWSRAECDVATCLMAAQSDRLADRISFDAANVYLQVVAPFSPHAPGFCILVRRTVHDAIGGFDESVLMAEDHDYVQRASHVARFSVLTEVRLRVSTRRLEREGLASLAIKYAWCEMHALAGVPVRSLPFRYAFGDWDAGGGERRTITDIGELRRQLGRMADPLQDLSSGARDRIDRLVEQEREGVHQVLRALDQADLNALQRYFRRRRAVLRATGRQARSRLAALQAAGRGEWLEDLSMRVRGRAGADEVD